MIFYKCYSVRNSIAFIISPAENQEVLAKLKDMKGASKNAVKRTIPKLDSNR